MLLLLLRKILLKKGSKEKNSDICQIPYIFYEVFLWEYHRKLFFLLQQIFDADKTALCCFLDDKFHYRGRDWYTGKTWSVSRSESIAYSKKLKMDELKKIGWSFSSRKKIKKYRLQNIYRFCLIIGWSIAKYNY